jgi:hypothetical protein
MLGTREPYLYLLLHLSSLCCSYLLLITMRRATLFDVCYSGFYVLRLRFVETKDNFWNTVKIRGSKLTRYASLSVPKANTCYCDRTANWKWGLAWKFCHSVSITVSNTNAHSLRSKTPPLVPTVSQLKPVHVCPTCFFKRHLKVFTFPSSAVLINYKQCGGQMTPVVRVTPFSTAYFTTAFCMLSTNQLLMKVNK